VRKPASSIIGTTHHTNLASPNKNQSTAFMDTSIDIMEIKLIPIAVLKARKITICLDSITVSKIILVIKPLTIAKIIIDKVGQGI